MAKYFTPIKKYLKIVNHVLSSKPEVIFEIGARDCKETIEFHTMMPGCKIVTFECNPDTLKECRDRVKGINQITLIEKAVSDTDGTTKFYKIDTKQTETQWADGNPGASSLLQASGKYPVEKYVQKTITVDTTRLETILDQLRISKIDLMWMDIQGAELLALKGLGGRIKDVSVIHLEVEFMEVYTQQPLFLDIESYLNENNFIFCGFTYIGRYFGDAVFVGRDIFKSNLVKKYYSVRGHLHKKFQSIFRLYYIAEKCVELVVARFK